MNDSTHPHAPDERLPFASGMAFDSTVENDSSHAGSDVKLPAGKRMLDVGIILLTLPIWLPVMVLISMWVLFVSRGPIFFRQERIGLKGHKFWCLKFRSMKVNADTQLHEGHFFELLNPDRPMTKLDTIGDPRLIRGGKLFRASGLDELPQIFNVLRGEMSLVGPRPCTPQEYRHYLPWQKERVTTLPGLTGNWQVNGKNYTTFSEMIAMDIDYSRNISVRRDCAILWKTVPTVLEEVRVTLAGSPRVRQAPMCDAA
ncbi:MAG: sugar transferase [Chthoniobacteraceae bacterium]